jgi:SNF2 family DNA or RNA helicase
MPLAKVKTRKNSSKKKKSYTKKTGSGILVSNTRKPDKMSDREWQTLLRIQIAEKESFIIKNLDHQPVYSDYAVYSAKSNNTYKVALRSKDNSLNFCSCPDFKTNQLGTCKHIEAVRSSLHKKKGIKKLLEEIPVLPYSSIYVSYSGERKIKLRVGTDNKSAFEKWASKYFDKEYTMFPVAYLNMDKLLQEASRINSSFRCYDDAIALIVEKRDAIKRETLVKNEGDKLLKGLVTASLFPYQKQGILFATKAGRAILADDMGLGKTVQAISWAILMHKHISTQKVIIICPTSLKYQWKTEIEKFTKSAVCVIEGNVLTRKSIYENDESHFKIVSYHMAGNDWESINLMRPDVVILDEAQRIKNWKAKISENIKRIRSPYALVLTGTPLENNIEELYSLVQYINPFLLGSLHQFLTRHQVKDPHTGKVTGYTGLNEIGQQLSTILLRRTKKEVLKQLPERMDKTLFVPMTEPQIQLHTEYSNAAAQIVNKWKRFGFLNEQDRQRLLNSLNIMRMVCDSTYILDQQTNYQTKLDELFNILDELLEMKGEKVVIFSQWERMTRLIAAELQDRKIKFEYLHGGIHSKKRESLFTNFNNDPDCRIFLSTDAGGVGLNLQAASNLINMDIPWNPAVLEQRIGRIYRMGQTKNVSIINLVAQDTIEHRMLSVLKFKSSVAAGILDHGEDSIFLGEDRFKQFMETVETFTQHPEEKAVISFDEEERKEIAPIDHKKGNQESQIHSILEDELVEEQPQTNDIQDSRTDDLSSASIVQNGMTFFSQLINALSDQQSVKKLVATITEKDEKTGQTWLKLPIENEQTIEKALQLVAGFFKGFGK